MNHSKVKKIEDKVTVRLDRILSLSVFDEPRPRYISKITIFDRFFNLTLLWLFPRSVRPNFFTVFRFVTVPFVAILLLAGDYVTGFWLFSISALSDALDGALARTRHQITDWGIVFDPIADKFLIGTVAIITISQAIDPALAATIVFLEILLVISSYYRFKGKLVPAKTVGKIKMILQCFGVAFLLLSLILASPLWLTVATYTLYTSILFALLSLVVYRSI